MKIQDILKEYQEHPEIGDFAARLKESEASRFRMKGMAGSQTAFLMAALYRHTHRNSLLILNDKEEALYFLNDLQTLMPQKEILFFPASYKRPYQIEELDNANVLQRAEVLNQLNHTSSGRQLIVTFAEALSERVVNKRTLVKHTLEVRVGDDCGMEFVTDVLEEYGFEREDFVYEPGQYAVRGGILDVYSFAHELPYRLDFFGEDVDSIRVFDPVSQISSESVNRISLIPNIQRRLLEEEKITFLEYLTPSTLVFAQNVDFVASTLNKQFERADEHYKESQEKSGGAATALKPTYAYTFGDEFMKDLAKFTVTEFGTQPHFKAFTDTLEWDGNPQPRFNKEFSLLARHLHDNRDAGVRNLLLHGNPKQEQRLREIFREIDAEVDFQGVENVVHHGFLDKKLNLACYTDHEIFERFHRYKSKAHVTRSQAITLRELKELQPGDFVVHINHGIGRFSGLHRIKTGQHEQEAVKIIYRDGDEVYVNVNSLYKISKYSGKDGTEPRLSKLGSAEWAKAKARTKKRLKELAFDLIALYAKRISSSGFAYTPDSYLQQELEASFMFEDTPDQIRVTEEVKQDMESQTPMDRLVCGDVGFGKTEIAIRAAFKAAVDGKQTAVLVPTTILALQHFHTFKDRLGDLPVTVDYLNRFRSPQQVKETLKRLKEGKVDILIGTHRIVSKDVKFKDLGLLVIDEEQKFGVGVKEKLKTLKATVDTLTLTATPIPRTMQFSLIGVRDLSVLQTPPPNRQPVETVVTTFSQEILRDAITYERKRGGQVFFVHNRVRELEEYGSMIKKLVPDARLAVAHGQLTGEKLERVWTDFIEGAYDVLVCTTIIESGLDIPNANTIIINQAQNYGLSDLHQMRGRVGRSNRKAFCYLFAPHEDALSRDARKRLKAIEEFSDLGSGFHIALRDLDIRGAGDLFGAEQSGFISEVGYDMYQKILSEAVEELKEEHFGEVFAEDLKKKKSKSKWVEDTQVETDLEVLIPEKYIPSVSERLNFYKRISGAEGEEDMRIISREMIDRFGPIPGQVLGLFDTVRIRESGQTLGFEKVVLHGDTLRLYFPGDKTSSYYAQPAFAAMIGWVQQNSGRARLKESPKYLSLVIKDISDLKAVMGLLRELENYVNEVAVTEG